MEFRNKFGKMVSSVMDGFKSMLDQLEWIQGTDRRKALHKADSMVRNIAYPDLVTDDAKLIAKLANLKLRNDSESGNFFDTLEDIEQFDNANRWETLLTVGRADRQDFGESPAIVSTETFERKFG